MQNVPVLITQNLDFDVLGARHVFFEEHRRVAKGAIGLAAGFIEQPLQILGLVHHAHATAATAKGGLDDQRKADVLGHLHRFGAGGDGIIGAGQNRHAGRLGQGARLGLVAHFAQQFGARSDKRNAHLRTGLGKVGVLRQKSVAGMDEVYPAFLGHLHNAVDVQIRPHRPLAHANEIGLIRLESVHRQPVFLRVNGHRAHVHLRGGAENTDGNLTAIGRHQFHRAIGR